MSPVNLRTKRLWRGGIESAAGMRNLRASLKKRLSTAQIEAAGVDPGARPETLDLESFAALSNTMDATRGNGG